MFAYVGCFTSRKGTHGKGISVYHVDDTTGAWSLIDVCDAPANPGFLVLDRRQRFLYAAHGDIGEVSAYGIDAQTGKLHLLNRQRTGGDNAPHMTLDPSGRHAVVAHGPGIAVFPVIRDGTLGAPCDTVLPPGEPGPYRHEQKGGAHPHQVVFDPSGRFLIAADKGVDRVHVYRWDQSGRLVSHGFVKCRYGAGPRHIAFHPAQPLAYLVNEIDSTVTAYQWHAEQGTLQAFQVLPTTPSTFTGDNTGAEIFVAPAGNFVYVSNRGHESIATFAIDATSGMLAPLRWEPTQGRKPRFFTVDPSGKQLYVAHEDSDTIVAFDIDHSIGRITPTGVVVETGTPTCIAFARSSGRLN
jgi:6-phosphogluconolactonase